MSSAKGVDQRILDPLGQVAGVDSAGVCHGAADREGVADFHVLVPPEGAETSVGFVGVARLERSERPQHTLGDARAEEDTVGRRDSSLRLHETALLGGVDAKLF